MLLRRSALIVLFILLSGSVLKLSGQIPLEVFSGHQRTTLDVMFFRFFLKADRQTSPWLFFNRNRASLDYRMNEEQYLPQMGFTEAVSWNHAALKGLAPVAVVQILNGGVSPKAGIQYARVNKKFTLFTWMVYNADDSQRADHFLLLRFTPELTENLLWFEQYESLFTMNFKVSGGNTWIQRARTGLSWKQWQGGVGADLSLSGRELSGIFFNAGIFLRHEF